MLTSNLVKHKNKARPMKYHNTTRNILLKDKILMIYIRTHKHKNYHTWKKKSLNHRLMYINTLKRIYFLGSCVQLYFVLLLYCLCIITSYYYYSLLDFF